VAATGLAVGLLAPTVAAAPSSAKKAKQVELARKLEAAKASDTALLNAVKTLDAQVKAADAASQSTRQSVKAAQVAANGAQARLQAAEDAMAKVRGTLMKRAIAEYMHPKQFSSSASLTGEDLTKFTRRKALLEHVTRADNDVLDSLRVTRQDLARQRDAAVKARAVTAARQRALEDQLRGLLRDRASRGRLSAALETRIQEIQAEATALAGDDRNIRNILSSGSKAPVANLGKASSSGLIWPLRGRLTSGFGRRWGKLHAGIDIAAPKGTPIHAAKGGTVVFAGQMQGYGNVVIIDHGGGLSTLYAHQSRLGSRRGQRVAQGQVIGYVGSTGHSTGNHCHFETRINGTAQNPRKYL